MLCKGPVTNLILIKLSGIFNNKSANMEQLIMPRLISLAESI